MRTERQKEARVRKLIAELFTLTDFEGVLTAALDGEYITSSDIVHASHIYEPPLEDGYDEKNRCVDEIDEAFERCLCDVSDEEKFINCMKYLPNISDVMEVIGKYYETDDILETFDSYDLFSACEDSYEMSEHDERLKKEHEAYVDELCDIWEDEEQKTLVSVLEGHPDEIWSLLADYGMCSNYDYPGIVRAVSNFITKLERSNYNQEHIDFRLALNDD